MSGARRSVQGRRAHLLGPAMVPAVTVNLRVLLAVLALLIGAAAPGLAEETGSDPRIVGGEEADPGEYPFMAALVRSNIANAKNGLRCGAAMLDAEWFLTAAHCTRGRLPAQLDIVVGRHELSSSQGERIGVAEIIEHPLYNPSTFENDLSLVRVETPASVGQPAPWVSDAHAGLFAAGTTSTVLGWGNTENNPPGTPSFPDGLREVDVPIRSAADCDASATGDGDEFFPDVMICAGFDEGGMDSCQGDSGGPLIVPSPQGPALAGIVSWGNGCADPGNFGFYTRVATFAFWILDETGADRCHSVLPTIFGTEGPDILDGTAGDDVIWALGGDDTVRGKGGDDILCGGFGNDVLYGGPGADMLSGAHGDDRMYGQGGGDRLDGGDLDDRLQGGPGDDLLDGGDGDDKVIAHGGEDIVYGGHGDDRLRGGTGSDIMDGGPGADEVFGVTDDDDLRGGAGDDDVRGQGGDDVARGEAGDDVIRGGTGIDELYGGSGTDTCIGGEIGLFGCDNL